jgi:hypothetical protein
MQPQGVDVEGVVQTGEVITRVYREALVEDDYLQREIAAAAKAYRNTVEWAEDRLAAAGPYDDVRTLQDLVIWLGDRIAGVHQVEDESHG